MLIVRECGQEILKEIKKKSLYKVKTPWIDKRHLRAKCKNEAAVTETADICHLWPHGQA